MKVLGLVFIQMAILLCIVFVTALGDVPKEMHWYECTECFMKNLKAFAPGFIVIIVVNIVKSYRQSNLK